MKTAEVSEKLNSSKIDDRENVDIIMNLLTEKIISLREISGKFGVIKFKEIIKYIQEKSQSF